MTTRTVKGSASATPDLDLVGGDAALNFINTLRAGGGEPIETLQSDQDVRAWMRKVGLSEPTVCGPMASGGLLKSARSLRALALTLLKQTKAGKRAELDSLNYYLSQARGHLTLHRKKHAFELNRKYLAASAEQMLAPVAEAIAALLAREDLNLVRRCEGSGCVLWFSDRPNGRPRRFCTEETCGTRTRVAAHRARIRGALL